ncbi:MAG: GNAT family N-acetyltransferase [Lachnospiraceae bacterium]|nr:GNAT family N-acetyltransferase [Lachnospiraceae bacterium]
MVENLEIKKMETDDEIRGKAYVHWKAWHEAYPGMVSDEYLEKMTLEKCEKMAYSWLDGLIVAKDNGRIIGFVGYGDRGDEAPDIGEIFALYVLSEYYGKGVAQQLMKAGLDQLSNYRQICLWVLKENKRAIRFYRKCGFVPTGEELISPRIGATEIRMILRGYYDGNGWKRI